MRNIDNTECLKDFGTYIREKREMKGLTQVDMAEILGISQAYYSLIERGGREVDLVLSLKICNILGLNMKSFIGKYL